MINTIQNKRLYELIKNLVHSFMDGLDRQFWIDYSSWYDRVKVIVEGNPNIIAKILWKRPDLKNKKLSQCLLNVKKCLRFLIKEKISKKPPHSLTKKDYQEELIFFLTRLFKEKDQLEKEGFGEFKSLFEK